MKWGSEPAEQRDLGGLGLAGICREISRVVQRVILPNFATFGPPLISSLLLANAVAYRAVISHIARGVVEGTTDLRLLVDSGPFIYLECICVIFILQILLLCGAAYVFCVASLYYTGGDLRLRAAHSVLSERLPIAPLTRLFLTFQLVAYSFLAANQLRLEGEIMLPLRLLGWAVVAYAAVVFQLACVVSVLEDAVLFGAVRRSFELLAGKFWTVATLLLTLDAAIITQLKNFPALMLGDALGLGFGFQLAAGAAMAVALWVQLHVALVAHPVVYMVCKSHRREVVVLVHLHGSTRLAVDGDN